MTDKPTLPPLPPTVLIRQLHAGIISSASPGFARGYEAHHMDAHGLSCYQAGYRKAIEDAAKVCEPAIGPRFSVDMMRAANLCIGAIRALGETMGEKG